MRNVFYRFIYASMEERSFMRFKSLDLILAMLVVAINVALTQFPGRFMIVGILFALPLIFFLPGYALTQTLFRGRAPVQKQSVPEDSAPQQDLKPGHPIGVTDQLLLSFGLSIAIDVLVG